MRKTAVILFMMIWAVFNLGLSSCGSSGDDVSSVKDSTIAADKIIKQIKQGKNISLKDKHIVGKLDFTKSQSLNKKLNVSAVYVPVEVCFVNCVFDDTVTAYDYDSEIKRTIWSVFDKNVCFQGCEFNAPVVMNQADFRGRADFDLSKFRSTSDFTGSHFGNGASFCMANFDMDAMFVSCTFERRGNFFKVFFRQSSVWQYCRFMDITMFSDAHFYGGVDISKVFAEGTLDFANSKFHSNLSVTNSQFLGDLRLVACRFSGNTVINGNQVYGTLNFQKAQFLNNTNITGNVLYTAPLCDDVQKSDSADVIQQKNLTVNLIEKQII